MAGATRPVGGGAYSGPRAEPGGQTTPRAGRSVASLGSYITVRGSLWQQVDQGDIFDEAAAGVVTASGASVEDYSADESGITTVTASGTRVESSVYNDDATYYDKVIDADNPVSHWKLGDSSTAADRKGTLNLTSSSSVAVASGIVANNAAGSANSFVRPGDGGQRFAALSGDTSRHSTPAVSLEVWYTPNSTPAGISTLLSLTNGSVELSASGATINFYMRGADFTLRPISVVGALTAGQTYHLVGVCDGSNLLIYVNGVQRNSRTIPSALPGLDLPRIAHGGSSNPDGVIDEAAWYDTALSSARVLAHYDAGNTSLGLTTVTASGSGAESFVNTDTASGTVAASGSGVESYAYTYDDSRSGTVIVSGTGVESFISIYTDSASGAVTASGTSSDSYAVSESGLGTATASGTVVESYTFSDSGYGTVVVDGSSVESNLTLQTLRPDADIAVAGWVVAPLYSKLSDDSDTTVVTGVLV